MNIMCIKFSFILCKYAHIGSKNYTPGSACIPFHVKETQNVLCHLSIPGGSIQMDKNIIHYLNNMGIGGQKKFKPNCRFAPL